MKKRIKYLIMIIILFILIIGLIDVFLKAKKKKDAQLAFEKDKIASKEIYKIDRNNNKYTIKGRKIENKTLTNIFYDNVSVYLYYDDNEKATLLKYNVESNKIVVIYEDSPEIHGGITKIGNYYKIGNTIYNSKFKKIRDYPIIGENELLFPDLKKVLIKTDNGVAIKDLKTNEEHEIIQNEEKIIYSPYNIKSDGKYILLNKEETKKSLVILNEEYEIINTIDNNKDEETKEFSLLDDVPYLLEKNNNEEKITYKIYNAKTLEQIYKSSNNLKNYLFDDTKFICNDKSGNLKLIDYVTKEEKPLLKSEKNNEFIAKKFILASDGYSLLLTLQNKNNEFYIFYL